MYCGIPTPVHLLWIKTEFFLENTLDKVSGTGIVKTMYIAFRNWIMLEPWSDRFTPARHQPLSLYDHKSHLSPLRMCHPDQMFGILRRGQESLQTLHRLGSTFPLGGSYIRSNTGPLDKTLKAFFSQLVLNRSKKQDKYTVNRDIWNQTNILQWNRKF